MHTFIYSYSKENKSSDVVTTTESYSKFVSCQTSDMVFTSVFYFYTLKVGLTWAEYNIDKPFFPYLTEQIQTMYT